VPHFDHVLLIGFGSPYNLQDIDSFLKIVSQGRNISEARIAEVRHHYELIGGGSPYNRCVFDLAAVLEERLHKQGVAIPVFSGMRNWHPFVRETLENLKKRNLQRGLAVILSPYRSPASCHRYKKCLTDALHEAQVSISYDYLERWFLDDEFIEAQAECVRPAAEKIKREHGENSYFLFSAHSIPVAMNLDCGACNYQSEHENLSAAVASRLGLGNWSVCYQSRSGNPREPWLGPDINETIALAGTKGVKEIHIIPSGFLINNAEVLYDLDIEAQQSAQKAGTTLSRSPVIGDYSDFQRFLTQRITQVFNA